MCGRVRQVDWGVDAGPVGRSEPCHRHDDMNAPELGDEVLVEAVQVEQHQDAVVRGGVDDVGDELDGRHSRHVVGALVRRRVHLAGWIVCVCACALMLWTRRRISIRPSWWAARH